jgi:tetratricopeptide (TPR) repeat protein
MGLPLLQLRDDWPWGYVGQLQARLGFGLMACLLLSACANKPAEIATTPTTPLDKQSLVNILAGEISLHRGLNQQASEYLLTSAQRTENISLAKRATYAAQLGNQVDTYRQASGTWAALEPDNIVAQQHLAQGLVLSTEPDKAKVILQKILATDPAYLPAQTLYAEVLLSANAFEEADQFLRNYTSQQQPNRVLAGMHLQALEALSDLDGAQALLSKLINNNPNDPELEWSIGMLYMQIDDYEQALTHLLKVATLDPNNAQIHYYLGLNYKQLNQPSFALKHFRMVSNGPHLMASLIEQIAISQPATQHTKAYFAGLRKQHPLQSVQIYLLQADYFTSLNEPAMADTTYAEALQTYPNNIPLLYSQAMLASQQGAWDKMESNLLRVIELDADHADALNALGYTYADHNSNLKMADVYIKRAFQLKPNDPAITDSMGWLAFRQGHYRLARDYLQQAFAAMPDAEIAAHLGVVEWALGNIERANQIWDSILANDPDNPLIKQAKLDAEKEFPHAD